MKKHKTKPKPDCSVPDELLIGEWGHTQSWNSSENLTSYLRANCHWADIDR